MNTYINTAAELDALPEYAVVLTDTETAYQKDSDVWLAAGSGRGIPSHSVSLPVTLIHPVIR